MSPSALRKDLKKAIDKLPPDRLESLADYVGFLSQPTLRQRLDQADKEFDAGKGISWRKVRRDV